jgi:peptide deformylase
MKLLEPNKILKESKELTDVKNIDYKTLNKMIDLGKANNGIAIAAPQVGIFKKFFISFVNLVTEGMSPTLYVNPYCEKTENSKEIDSEEGCISYNLGKDKYIVSRYDIIKASWDFFDDNSNLVRFEHEIKGDYSIIFQHETDHLYGITIASKGNKI